MKLVSEQGAFIKRTTKWCNGSFGGGPPLYVPKDLLTFVKTWSQVVATACAKP